MHDASQSVGPELATSLRSRRLSAPATVFGLLCAMYLIMYIDRVNIATAAPLIKADLHLNNTQLGIIFSAFAVFYTLFTPVGGWIGDRLGARLTLTLCGAVVALASVLTGLVAGFAALFATRLCLGFGEGPTFPTATRAMTRWVPETRRAFAQGLTHSFARIGNALAPPLIAWLILLISWRGSFVIMGLASLAWLCIWAWFFRNDPREHPGITAADLALLPALTSNERRQVPWLRLARRMFPVIVVDFAYGWVLWLFLSWIPSFFYENYHLNLQRSAFFSAGVLFSGVVGDSVGGVASDAILRKTGNLKLARRAVIIAGFAGGFVFLIPMILVRDLNLAAICLALAFFFAELIVAPMWAVPMDIAPSYSGSASGIMNVGFGVAGLISPLSFGYLVDRTGSWVVPFAGSLALLAVGAIFAARLRPDLPFEEMQALAFVSLESTPEKSK